MPLLHPNYLKFEKPKNELYLTLSALVDKSYYSEIVRIQNRITSIISKHALTKKIVLVRNCNQLVNDFRSVGRLIYIYPKERLHISIFSLATYNIVNLHEFDTAREVIEDTPNFNKLKRIIIGFKDDFTRQILSNNEEINVKIKGLFLPAGLEGSISLSVFPNSSGFSYNLNKFKKHVQTQLDKELLANEFKIKAYPEQTPQYFALNIFRFIDNAEYVTNIGPEFYSQLRSVSEIIEEKPIDINMIPCITISDPYLSNKKYTASW